MYLFVHKLKFKQLSVQLPICHKHLMSSDRILKIFEVNFNVIYFSLVVRVCQMINTAICASLVSLVCDSVQVLLVTFTYTYYYYIVVWHLSLPCCPNLCFLSSQYDGLPQIPNLQEVLKNKCINLDLIMVLQCVKPLYIIAQIR